MHNVGPKLPARDKPRRLSTAKTEEKLVNSTLLHYRVARVCGTWQDISERSRGRKILFYTEWIYYISYINVHCRDIGQLDSLAEFFVKRFIVISLSCVSFAAHPA